MHEFLHEAVIGGVEGEHAIMDLDLEHVFARVVWSPVDVQVGVPDTVLFKLNLAVLVFIRHRDDIALDALDIAQCCRVVRLFFQAFFVLGVAEGE